MQNNIFLAVLWDVVFAALAPAASADLGRRAMSDRDMESEAREAEVAEMAAESSFDASVLHPKLPYFSLGMIIVKICRFLDEEPGIQVGLKLEIQGAPHSWVNHDLPHQIAITRVIRLFSGITK